MSDDRNPTSGYDRLLVVLCIAFPISLAALAVCIVRFTAFVFGNSR